MSLGDATGSLYSLDTTTGDAMPIGPTGIGGIGAMVFENGVLYGIVDNYPYSLCTLNTSTGAGTIVAPTPAYTLGLAPVIENGIYLTPTKLAFGTRLVGATSPLKTVTLTNVGIRRWTSLASRQQVNSSSRTPARPACPVAPVARLT